MVTPSTSALASNVEDESAWGSRGDLDASLGAYTYTYPTPIQLTGETNDPIYLFYRGRDSAGGASYSPYWAYGKSEDGGATWAAQQKVHSLTYSKIARNGTDRIDFAVSSHPQDSADHGIYHCYYQGGHYYQSNGTEITDALPISYTAMTQVYDGSTYKGWVWDIAIEAATGYPIITFVKFVSLTDHRYMYARWNGSSWDVNEICAGGGTIYGSAGAEDYYSGGISIDHSNPDVVYLSKQVIGQFEVYQYTTADGGASWTNAAITSSSGWKNIRPYVPMDHAAGLGVLWLAGAYDKYTNYSVTIRFGDALSAAASAWFACALVIT